MPLQIILSPAVLWRLSVIIVTVKSGIHYHVLFSTWAMNILALHWRVSSALPHELLNLLHRQKCGTDMHLSTS